MNESGEEKLFRIAGRKRWETKLGVPPRKAREINEKPSRG
jgi:hypothetical protein